MITRGLHLVPRIDQRMASDPIPIEMLATCQSHTFWYPSLLINVTTHGSRIMTSAPLRRGQKLKLLAPTDTPLSVGAEVVWVKKVDANRQEVELGVKFLGNTPIDYWRNPHCKVA